MGYESDLYMDEDGEPLMDPDDGPSDGDPSPYVGNQLDDDSDEEWRRERSMTPSHDDYKFRKWRKRLVKKGTMESCPEGSGILSGQAFVREDLDDWEEMEALSNKRQKSYFGKFWKDSSRVKEKKKVLTKSGRPVGKAFSSVSKGYEVGSADIGGDPEMHELWDTIEGDDSEDYQGGRTANDDAFIDDTVVEHVAPQAEEDNEMNKVFKTGKKKKKHEKSRAELAMTVETLMAPPLDSGVVELSCPSSELDSRGKKPECSFFQDLTTKLREMSDICHTWNDLHVCLEDELESTRGKLDCAEKSLASAKRRKAKTLARLDRTESELDEAMTEIKLLQEEINRLEVEAEKLQVSHEETINVLDGAQPDMLHQDAEIQQLKCEIARLTSLQPDSVAAKAAAVAEYKQSPTYIVECSRIADKACTELMANEVDEILEIECEVSFRRGFDKGLRLARRFPERNVDDLKVEDASEDDDGDDVDIGG